VTLGYEVPIIIAGLSAGALAIANSARSAAPYTFLMAKVRAWEARMIGDAKAESLAEAGTMEALISGFRGTDYESDLEGVDQDTDQLEASAMNHLIRSYREVIGLVPGRAEPFLRKFSERLDLGNMKLVIQSVSGEVDTDLAISQLTDGMVFTRDRMEVAAKSESVQNLVEQLSETDYHDQLEILVRSGEYDALELMRSVERSYYTSVWERAADLGRKNRGIAREILGREIDLINLKTVLRLKGSGAGTDRIMRSIIPIYADLNLETLRACAQTETMEDLRGVLSRSALKFLVPLLSSAGEDICVVEALLDESLLNFCKGTSLFKPLTIATPLAYIYEKHAEVRNIRTLARGVGDEIGAAEIKQLLLRSARVE
jgi:ATP synthase A1 C subunit